MRNYFLSLSRKTMWFFLRSETQRQMFKRVFIYHLQEVAKRRFYIYACLNYRLLCYKKNKIRVVFLVHDYAVWKVNPVFQRMLDDPCFEPLILVCPLIAFEKTKMKERMELTFNYFKQKKYPVLSSYDNDNNCWLKLSNKLLRPDLVFFTNPHDLTHPFYYKQAYARYLCCYVPYHHEVGYYEKGHPDHNQGFHNAMWAIFASHEVSKKTSVAVAANKGKNVIVTGYPATEVFFDCSYNPKNVWKKQTVNKKKIIWAPHHTIASDSLLAYSTFLQYADLMKELVQFKKNTFQWAFKPHPLLKHRLYNHIDWGIERTNDFYAFWRDSDNTQLEEGEYNDLFLTSDGMLHDSGSFLAEYLYVNKPVAYFVRDDKLRERFNSFGQMAFDQLYHIFNNDDIIAFLDRIEHPELDNKKETRQHFINYNLHVKEDNLPSNKIVDYIKDNLISI